MRWTPGGRNDNLEDRRGDSGDGGGLGGGGGGGGGIKLGLGGTVVVLVLSLVFHKDFLGMLDTGAVSAPTTDAPVSGRPVQSSAAEDTLVQFVNFLLTDTQKTWRDTFAASGKPYQDAKLVLFRDHIQSACGFAQSATGPFYCPGDGKVYIDLGFYDELKKRFGAPGEFAQAYVLAHEFGHHVQNLLGTERQMRRLVQQNPGKANALSVDMELQADCYAGVWGYSANKRGLLDPGDVDDGLRAAASVGDDRLQKMGQGYVNPESFTHGSSAQRMDWFKRGFVSGDINACDTFAAK
jgi:predicted metalloprotease